MRAWVVVRTCLLAFVVLCLLELVPGLAEVLDVVREASSAELVTYALVGAFCWVGYRGVRDLLRRPKVTVATGLGAVTPLATMAPRRTASPEHLPRVARHEAAHVVAARAMGLDVEYATLRSEGDSGGHVRWRSFPGQPLGDVMWAGLVTTLAGHTQDIADGHFDNGSCADIGTAYAEALTIISHQLRPTTLPNGVPMTAEGLITAARNEVKAILDRNGGALDEISRRLTLAGAAHVPGEQLEDVAIERNEGE